MKKGEPLCESCKAVLPEAPTFEISAVTGEGTEALCYATAEALEDQRVRELEDPMRRKRRSPCRRPSMRICWLALRKRAASAQGLSLNKDEDDDEDDNSDVEVHYVPLRDRQRLPLGTPGPIGPARPWALSACGTPDGGSSKLAAPC